MDNCCDRLWEDTKTTGALKNFSKESFTIDGMLFYIKRPKIRVIIVKNASCKNNIDRKLKWLVLGMGGADKFWSNSHLVFHNFVLY